ncbi:MAG: MMPL family transporter [Candidatus Coatesbacteria bacterium]|nr:MMPL family transporter [Candidatus Coatesbacteria bacterium]
MLEKFLGRIAGLCFRRSLTVILVASLLIAGALFLVSRLEFSADVRQLLPTSDRRVTEYFDAMSRFAGSETLIGVVSTANEEDLRLMQEFVKHFSESINKSELLEGVDFNINSIALAFLGEFFLEHLFLFLDEQDFRDAAESLSADGMKRALKQARATLISQAGLVQKEFIEHDPLDLRRFLFKYSPKLKQGIKLDLVDGYYFSTDHKMAFVLIYPSRPAQNLDFDRALLGLLQHAAALTRNWLDDLHGWESGEAARRLSMSFTGAHAIMLEESDVIKHDMLGTLSVSFVLVLLLFVAAFGRLGSLVFVGVPLLSALIFTLALCYLTLGYVNLLTIVLLVSIVGLGIDFALHLYSRYADERASGKASPDALQTSYTKTGIGTLGCAATTSLAFLSCALSRFKGIKELGLLAAAGIIICLATTLVLMGALLKQGERFAGRKSKARSPRSLRGPLVHGLSFISRLASNRPRAIVAVWVTLTLLAGIRVSKMEFSQDVSTLRAKSSKAFALQRTVSDAVSGSFKDFCISKTVPDSATALEFSEAVQGVSKEMIADGTLSSASSLLDFLPKVSRQRESIERLAQLSEHVSPQSVVSGFEAAAAESGLRMTDTYRGYIRRLASSLSVREIIDLRAATADTSIRRLLGRFLKVDEGGLHVACYASPAKLLSTGRDVIAFEKALRERLGGEVSITSTTYLTAILKELILKDIWLVAIVASAFVFGVLLVQFKRPSIAFVAMAPLCSGGLMMLAAASMLGIDLNPVNLFVIPMILGIGIDNGIHIVHRYLERKSTAGEAIVGAGQALVLAALTTILAFGTLVFAGFEGLVQIGALTILGVSFTLLASLTFLPALLIRFIRRGDDTT